MTNFNWKINPHTKQAEGWFGPVLIASWQGTWKNLVIQKNGVWRLGLKTFANRFAAKNNMTQLEADIKKNDKFTIQTLQGDMPANQYEYSVQVPWLLNKVTEKPVFSKIKSKNKRRR